MADKLGLEFALIHRKRKGKSLSAPEAMEILVGDVKDKVSDIHRRNYINKCECLFLGCNPCG